MSEMVERVARAMFPTFWEPDGDKLYREGALEKARIAIEAMRPTFEEKTAINQRFQELYDAGMQSGKHGHYETMFGAMHQAYAGSDRGSPFGGKLNRSF